MNKFLTLFITVFLVLGMTIVYAQEETTVTEDIDAITPESSLYGLNNAYERISLALTFNKAKKAQKGLNFARERILAAKKLVAENKLEHLQRLKEDHKRLLDDAKANLEKISEDDSEEEINKQADLKIRLEDQQNILEEVSSSADLKIVGKLSEEQLAKLNDFLNSLDKNIGEVKIKLNDKENKLKIRLKNSGKTDKEIEDKLKEIEEKHKLSEVKLKNAEKDVERLEQKLEKLKEIVQKHKDRGRDVVDMEQRLQDVEGIIKEIKTKLETNDLEQIRALIKKAHQLLNFREAFRALENNDNEKLTELKKLRIEKLSEIKKDIKELKEVRKELKETRETEREAIKEKLEAEKEAREKNSERDNTADKEGKTEEAVPA